MKQTKIQTENKTQRKQTKRIKKQYHLIAEQNCSTKTVIIEHNKNNIPTQNKIAAAPNIDQIKYGREFYLKQK